MGALLSIAAFAILVYLFFKVRNMEEMLKYQSFKIDQLKTLISKEKDKDRRESPDHPE
ncbi:hypothetical protein LCM20_05385 [Halobacillus litoralis]|uniref:hypothetical protein n=1 Tax=Halobacillus litoralis TaxID=45668 RepID=UPI001CD66ED8|nr:hypothetical protein [Halobacillus litoralis]MCA0970013.1 hypothetical protein [Halobacillus litoralis]